MYKDWYCVAVIVTSLSTLIVSESALAYDLRANFVANGGSVDIRNAGDGSGRLFLVRQEGRVDILKDGVVLGKPFLDITDRVADAPTDYFDEYNYGLLSIAFPPDFASSGVLYANYTNNAFTQTVSRFRLSADPQAADPDSEQILLQFTLPSVSHNGGHLKFGPDGYLYISVGDGQDSGVPTDNPQTLDNVMGKILRIDVSPDHSPYAIPPDNPFLGSPGALGEIWSYGLRNPWRIAFDPLTHDLYIADVGESLREEVDFQPANSPGGINYGWRIMEGSYCRQSKSKCNTSSLTLPVAEFPHHNTGPNGQGCNAVIGGEVYRGSDYPALYGMYIYADGCTGKTWGLTCGQGACENRLLADKVRVYGGPGDGQTVDWVNTFGMGEDGSLYLSDFGWTYKLSDGPLIEEEPAFSINTGLNDVWYNPETGGQGFFFTVYPELGIMFAGLFTFDLDNFQLGSPAILGDAAHRWLTAYGPYSGDTATLQFELTRGGIFDDSLPVTQEPDYGTLTVTFDPDCLHATAHVLIPGPGIDRVIPLQRIANDNRQICLDLATKANGSK